MSDPVAPETGIERPYDAGSEQDVAEGKRGRRYRRRVDIAMWDAVLDTVAGRYVINCILEEMSRPFAGSFDAQNPRLTDFREGERNVGNKLISRAFGKRPQLFNLMREEHAKRQDGGR